MDFSPPFTINKEFAEHYVQYFEEKNDSLEDYSMHLMDLETKGKWDQVWLALNEVVKLETSMSDSTLGVIAAGPLKELLNYEGSKYIEQILTLAQTNNIFARMLTGVWKSEIDQEVWDKVVKFCRTVKQPIDKTYGY